MDLVIIASFDDSTIFAKFWISSFAFLLSVISLAIAEIATSFPNESRTGERVTETFNIVPSFLNLRGNYSAYQNQLIDIDFDETDMSDY